MSVAVLDVGKTNVKVVLFDDDGAILAERSRANAALPPDAQWPYPRLDVETIWTFLLASLAELQSVAPIATISISTHGAAGVLIDDDGPARHQWTMSSPASANSTPNTTRCALPSQRR